MESYKVLIVDDCESIQDLTEMMLESINITSVSLKTIKAHSAAEAIRILNDEPTIELIILDLFMEHKDSGLEVVKFVRESLKNKESRIILRTGDESFAKDNIEEFFLKYDINDFYTKKDIDLSRFSILILSSIKSFQRLQEIKEKQRQLLKERLEGKVKNNFFNLLSHEINTPLNGVVANLDLINKSKLDKETADFIESAKESVTELRRNFEGLFNYAELKNTDINPQTKDVDLDKLMQKIISDYKEEINKDIIELSYQNLGVNKHLKTDPNIIEQVLNHMMSNAIKYTDKGKITLSLIRVVEEIGQREWIYFVVKDTGKGIQCKTKDCLFKKIQKTDCEMYHQGCDGLGLGLPLAYSLLNDLDSDLEFMSDSGKGSVFWFRLPANTKKRKPRKISDFKDGIFLYVEDNIVNQLIAQKIFKKLGANLDVVNDGEEAIEQLNKKEYDLILMDYSMPKMNGLQATRYIRENISNDLPIVGVTAFLEKNLIKDCIRCGMNKVIHKPFNLEDIKNIIKKYSKIPVEK